MDHVEDDSSMKDRVLQHTHTRPRRDLT